MGIKVKIDWIALFLLLLALIALGLILMFMRTEIPLARLEAQVLNPIEMAVRPAETPTAG